MINELMNKVMSKRIPQIENYMRHPIEVQDELLMGLIDSAKIQFGAGTTTTNQ